MVDAGSFREYDMFVEHSCSNFGMDHPSKKVCSVVHTITYIYVWWPLINKDWTGTFVYGSVYMFSMVCSDFVLTTC